MSARFCSTRRRFLQRSAGLAAAGSFLPDWLGDLTYGYQPVNAEKNDRHVLGAIGVGGQGTQIMRRALEFADLAAVADVDSKHAEKAAENTKAEVFDDYRRILERPDIDVVTIGTPDHWHAKICIEALRAGKDVYCEKPLTLTIEEGQQLVKVVQETGKILQVGTQQRSESGLVFLRAVATAQSGQLGKLKRLVVSLPESTPEGGPFEVVPPPENLNWDNWLGPAPDANYCPERCHFNFRWWYDYSGGIVTDWGAHHLDIAQWAMGLDHLGPRTIDGSKTVLPRVKNGYNTPKRPLINYTYDGDIKLQVVTGDEFISIEGDKGAIRVDRKQITGKPIEEQDADAGLKDKLNARMAELYRPGKPGSHMANFFEAVKSRTQPISDVVSQHRSATTCHLGNISIRLRRMLTWDPELEVFVSDEAADAMTKREKREPFTIEMKLKKKTNEKAES